MVKIVKKTSRLVQRKGTSCVKQKKAVVSSKIRPKLSKIAKRGNKSVQDANDESLDHTNSLIALSDDDDDAGDEVHDHQAALQRLKVTDPEFYAFLEENDQRLLNFDVSDAEPEEEDVHVPSEHLEVASDESDFEDETSRSEQPGGAVKVTLAQLKSWQERLQTENQSNSAILEAISVFNAALATLSTSREASESSAYKVEGGAVFNGAIQLCVMHLGGAVHRFLRLKSQQAPHTAKRFAKVRAPLRTYFADLALLLAGVAHTSGNIAVVLMRHVHEMAPLLVSFAAQARALIRRAVRLWGASSNERVRVLSFLAIVRLVNDARDAHLERTLKMMYLTYVQNARFVSVASLPAINFMRRSLVEVFAMDPHVAYRHVFLYVRQLAIHLRNAMCARTRDHLQVVYNWQYVNSLRLWGALLARTPHLDALVYPFVQVCLGCMRLQPTAAYVPLRFHICQILSEVARSAAVFAPVLPFLVDALSLVPGGGNQKVSMKPLSLECALRVGKAQMAESGFKDAVIEGVYAGILEYTAVHASSIAFPELIVMPKLQIKQFVGKCKVRKYTQKMTQLLEKLEENAVFIEQARSKFAQHSLSDRKQIDAWETQMRNAGTPMTRFFATWDAQRTAKRAKFATNNTAIGDYNLPTLVRRPKPAARPAADVELFPSDSSDTETTTTTKAKTVRGKRGGKKGKRAKTSEAVEESQDVEDVVQDITDWQ